ncbi:hypothetical protein APR04_001737 [Promicromonospora umidemergens]|uniref:Uncharacterized protein n=1 Tax=Promicromonospora umidemergens TaxID=629679 RepID=A0ABP8XI32_9MICO|nr:hypothetical protein [Promicromonospora umidemergens]MCP2282834.1 hypothetical protein [Promicromonospora umidemergens]
MATEEELDHADTAVAERHITLDADAGYALLAQRIWTALRGLGVERGRMSAFGDHAATLAGAPDPDTRTNYQEWVADIPPASRAAHPAWPHDGLSLRARSETEPVVHDLVFASLPYSDLHFRSQYGRDRSLEIHQKFLTNAVASTFPGGILAAVTTHRVLDNPDPAVRELLLDNADLLGAVRLPATALRPQLSDDDAAPIDLLLLRRRIPGDAVHSAFFLDVAPVAVPGRVAFVNEYFSMFYPEHVAGTTGVIADPDKPSGLRYTVGDGDVALDVALDHTLSNIVAKARARNLTAVSATWSPIETRLAREARRPIRRSNEPGHDLGL